MGKIILFPTHEDYCNTCKYHVQFPDSCSSQEYIHNAYLVVCVWKYCKYRKEVKPPKI